MTTEIIKTSSRSVEEIRNMSKDQLEQYAENKSKENFDKDYFFEIVNGVLNCQCCNKWNI